MVPIDDEMNDQGDVEQDSEIIDDFETLA
uniref:Uncharacterized protein n=1 Tax=Acrobeloides nanus TaxID=290746 RepID=A0A914E4R7_9BILA